MCQRHGYSKSVSCCILEGNECCACCRILDCKYREFPYEEQEENQ